MDLSVECLPTTQSRSPDAVDNVESRTPITKMLLAHDADLGLTNTYLVLCGVGVMPIPVVIIPVGNVLSSRFSAAPFLGVLT